MGGQTGKLDDGNTTGFYTELIACTAANGFEAGKTYTVYIEATVGGDTGGIAYSFKVKEDLDVVPALIGAIGSGTGAALNFAPDDDSVDGAIVGGVFCDI